MKNTSFVLQLPVDKVTQTKLIFCGYNHEIKNKEILFALSKISTIFEKMCSISGKCNKYVTIAVVLWLNNYI